MAGETQFPRTEQTKEAASAAMETGRSTASGQSGAFSTAASDAARRLSPQGEPLAQFAQRCSEGCSQLAEGASHLAERLRTQSVEGLFADVHSVARKNPTAFLIGSVIAGIALSRLVRPRAQQSESGMGASSWDSH